MPQGNPNACIGDCADNIAQYMLDAFWSESASSRLVSAASARSVALSPIVNGGAEAGIDPWYVLGNGSASIAQANAQAHSGTYSILVFDRAAAGDGAGQTMQGLVVGNSYQVSVHVRLNSGNDQVALRALVTGDDAQLLTLATAAASDAGWTEVTGVYQHQADAAVTVYLDGPAAGVIYYLDDLMVIGQ